MKIAFLLPQNVIGGGILVVYQHAVYLKKSGHDVLIIYREYKPGRDKNIITDFGLSFAEFDKMLVPDYHFDVIFGTWWATLYDAFVFDARNYFYLIQDDERRFYEDKTALEIKFCGLTYCFPAIGAITVASWLQTMISQESGGKPKVAPNGYDPLKFYRDKAHEKPEKKLRVLLEGPGKIWFKRLDDCFKALADISDIEVWFVSRDGYREKTWHTDRFFVNVSSEELREIYCSCDVLLKMSEVESFCLPNLEMMACGGTIITTSFTGHEEYAVDGYNSIVIPIRGIEAAHNAVIKLRDDRLLLERLRLNALATAGNMTWAHANKKFVTGLEELVAEFGGYDYTGLRKVFLELRELLLTTSIARAEKIKVEKRYNELFYQFNRNEYRLFRFAGRMVYKIPGIGSLLRKCFA